MNTFSSKERYIASVLAKFPKIKRSLKLVYSYLNYYRYRKPYKVDCDFPLKEYGQQSCESFFGYYDQSVSSSCGNYVIFQEVCGVNNDGSNLVQLVCIDDSTGDVVYRADTRAVNLQQGCKLQWLMGLSFIYNHYSEDVGYHSRIVDLSSGEVSTLPVPVYDCFECEYALCLNYCRLAKFSPDYGYFEHGESDISSLPGEDGIWIMRLSDGICNLVASLEEISSIASVNYDPGIIRVRRSNHTVNHIMISPDGKNFIFIHRWYVNGVRFDRLVLSSRHGDMRVLSDNGMVSHCCWDGNDKIFAYLKGDDGTVGYWHIDLVSGVQKHFFNDVLLSIGDGHPSIKNGWLLTDSYPDRARMQHLVAVHLKSGKVIKLGEFFHGLEFYEQGRCDLHPRFSFDGSKVFFDSVYSGKRRLYSIDARFN